MNYDDLTLEEYRKLPNKEATKVPRAVRERLLNEMRIKDGAYVYDKSRAELLRDL